MNKRVIFILKLVVSLAVIAFIAWEISRNADALRAEHFTVDWLLVAGSVASFAAFMVQSALVWRWIARRMGDRSPLIPALGAYVFSQMGKYVPGKVTLLLMRIDRTRRIGMDTQICVVATLLENAMYMVSGALVAIVTLLIYAHDNILLTLPLLAGAAGMCVVFHPTVFYRILNRLLRKMNRPEVAPDQRLVTRHLIAAVLGFLPCWILGGLSLYLATRALILENPGPFAAPNAADFAKFPGFVAFGVTGGMASILPGGMGAKEAIQGIFLVPIVGKTWATLAVVLARLTQVSAELLMGLLGGALTSIRQPRTPAPISSKAP